MAEQAVAAPAPPDGLAASRSRLLSAAAALGAAEASADDCLADALDDCLERVAAGTPVDAALSRHADAAAALAPLLTLCATARAQVIVPPRAPTRLERGRDRLLAAAAEATEVAERAAARADGDASLADALDTCVRDLAAGLSVADAVARHPHQTAPLTGLATVAARVARSVVPAPPADLARGRSRLLTAAAEALGPRSRPGLLSLLGAFAPGRPLSVARLAATVVAVAAVLFVSGRTLAPVAAASVPGDALYSVKRIGEQVRLALAFDPDSRHALEAGYSRERARELDALLDEGRPAEIDRWQVRYRGMEDLGRPQGPSFGVLHVTLLDDSSELRSLSWDRDTTFDPTDRYDSWSAVPPGVRLTIKLEVVPEKLPRALAVRLDEPDQPEATATPSATLVDETNVPMGTSTEVTPTPATATATATPTDATLTETALPTPSETPSVTPTAAVGETPRPADTRATLRGVVEAKPDDANWVVIEQVRDQDAAAARRIAVDVSAVAPEGRDAVAVGDWVQLHGAWDGPGRTRFVARAIDRVRHTGQALPSKTCAMHTAVGRVAQVAAGQALTLVDGSVYDLARMAAGAVPDLKAGARVEISYEDCGDGHRTAQSVRLLDEAVSGVYQGTVDAATATQFVLVTRRGARITVRLDAATSIVGAPAIRDGQYVQVRGWEDDDGIVHAEEVRVRASETATPETAGTPTAPATPTEALTATTATTPTPGTADLWWPGATPAVVPTGAPGLAPLDLPTR